MSDKIQELKMNELKDMFFYTFGIVPLQNYGVVGDGMTDNRLKIQQAIYDAIEVKAKYIFVPKGNYYYSQELFRADEVAWLGNSVDAHIKGIEIKQFPSFDNVVNITDAYSENKQDTYSATYINNEIDKKVDKIDGKDLSTNDFTDEYKQKIDNKVDKVEGKDLSTNDFTDEYKQKIDSINTYSTTEQVVGTWIDGKPIYKKTIYLTSDISRNTENIITHNISNFEILIDYEGGFVRNDGKNEPIPMVHKTISDWGNSCYDFDSTQFTLWIGTLDNSFTITKTWITLYYTKTTD